MALTVVGVQTWASSTSAASHTLPMPSGVQAGDLLLAFVAYPSASAPTTSSSGWTRVTYDGNGYVTTALFAKTATASNSLEVSVGASRYMDAVVYGIRGAASYAAAANQGMASASAAAAPTVTLGASAAFTCLIALGVQTNRSVTAYPANYGTPYSTTPASSHCAIYAASRAGLSGASVSPGNWTLSFSSAYFAAITVAVLSADAIATATRFPGPLGALTPVGTVISPAEARAALSGPLGGLTLAGTVVNPVQGWAALPGPLGAPAVTGAVIAPPQARAALPGPLGGFQSLVRRLAQVRWTHAAPATFYALAAVRWTHAARARLLPAVDLYWTHVAPADLPPDAPVYWTHRAPATLAVDANLWWTHRAPATLAVDANLWWTHRAPATLAVDANLWWTHTAPAALTQTLYWTHTAPADLLPQDPVRWTHLAPALLLDSLVQVLTAAPVLDYPGGSCCPLQVTLSGAEDSPAWLADLDLDDREVAQAIPLGAALTLHLNGTAYALRCDGVTRRRDVGRTAFTLKAVSPVMGLGSDWTAPVTLGAGMAHHVVERLLDQSVTWDLLDWKLPTAVATLTDAPLALARAIVEAVGGRLESRPDGTLRARPQQAVDPRDYPTATPAARLTDANLLAVQETIGDIAIANRFTIQGATTTDAIQLESSVDPTDPTTYTIAAYPSPWRPITLVHTGDAQTELGALTERVSECHELIEIRAGVGTVAYPVATLVDWTYQHQALGALHAEGTHITTTHDGYSLVWVDYQTRAWVATATNPARETIQFLAMEPS